MAGIPKGLGTIQDLYSRFAKAESTRESWRSIHQEAFDFAAPNRETFTVHAQGQEKNRQIYDSTAVLGLQQFANRIQSALLPPWLEWMNLVAGSDIPDNDSDKVNEGLEEITKAVFAELNHSNFYTELAPALIDLGIGTGGISVEEGDFTKGEALKFTNIPLAELYPEKPPGGAIESVWRKQQVKPSHIKRLWPQAELPQELADKAKKETSKDVTILNAMLFNPKDGKYHQIIIHKATKAVLYTQSFTSKRVICFRWHLTPGEVFGRGPVIQQLPDIRTVNKVKEFILRNAALQIAGVYTGVDDGIFNPHTVQIAPGAVIPVGSNASANPTMRPLDRSGDLGLGDNLMRELQESIRKALFADPMGDLTDPVRSATEVMLRNQDLLRNQGASFGRQKVELIEPVVNAVIDILRSLGKVPDIKVDGKEVAIRLTSPLAKAEGQEDFQNSQIWFNAVAQSLPQEVVAASVKIEELPRYWQETLGVPASLVRTEEETKQIAQAVQQAAEQNIEGGQPQGAPSGQQA